MILHEPTTSTIYVTQKRDVKLSVKTIAKTTTTIIVIITLIPTLKI